MNRRFLTALLAAALFLPSSAGADTLHLKRGGELRGTLLTAPDAAHLTIRTLSGIEVTVTADEVADVQRRSAVREEYVTRSRRIPDTPEARWELAEWCRRQGLMNQRDEQLELLLGVDPNNVQVRKILGYTFESGEWLTREELMTRRGYVRHKGKWVTLQEYDLIAKSDAQRAAEQAWVPRIKNWVAGITGGDERQYQNGLGQLQQVRDPDAVYALQLVMSGHADARIRGLLVQLLGRIEGAEAVTLLVRHHLLDGDAGVRQQAKEALDPGRRGLAQNVLIQGLRDPSNTVVARSASWLGEIGDANAIPALINALSTTHSYNVQVPSNDGIGVTTGPNGQMSFGGPNSGGLPIPPQIELMARTGQLPYGAVVVDNTPRTMKTVTMQTTVRNPSVLSALENLTGKNFGYNPRDWHLWLAIQKG